MKSFAQSLYIQVLVAIVIGVLIGHYAPAFGVELKPLGDAFIKLVKMIITPVIFCTVVLGIAGMEDLRSVGRTGLYALGYFEAVTTLALVVSWFAAVEQKDRRGAGQSRHAVRGARSLWVSGRVQPG